MKRITIHLSGVKKITTEKKIKKDGVNIFVKKTICLNTVTTNVKNEAEGRAFMSFYLDNHRGHKITKHYYTNTV